MSKQLFNYTKKNKWEYHLEVRISGGLILRMMQNYLMKPLLMPLIKLTHLDRIQVKVDEIKNVSSEDWDTL